MTGLHATAMNSGDHTINASITHGGFVRNLDDNERRYIRRMSAMTISLHPDLQKFVEEKIRAGFYRSPEEAVNDMLSQVYEQENLSAEDLADLRKEVKVGIDEADKGKFVEFTAEDVIAEKHAARKTKKGA
jgi:antitoxin ParD1/3/4